MITIVIKNIENPELESKLKKIINNEELFLENILDTINEEDNYNKLVLTLKSLSERSQTIKKLCQRLERNPLNFNTKSHSVLENLQKGMYWHFSQIRNYNMN